MHGLAKATLFIGFVNLARVAWSIVWAAFVWLLCLSIDSLTWLIRKARGLQ